MSKSPQNQDVLSQLEDLINKGKKADVTNLVSNALLANKRSELTQVQKRQLDNLAGYIYNQLSGFVVAKFSDRPQIDELSKALGEETQEQLTTLIGMTAGTDKTNRFKGLIVNLVQKNLTHVTEEAGRKNAQERDRNVYAQNKENIAARDKESLDGERKERRGNISNAKKAIDAEQVRRTDKSADSNNAELTRRNNAKHVASEIKKYAGLSPSDAAFEKSREAKNAKAMAKKAVDAEQVRRTDKSADSNNAELTRRNNAKHTSGILGFNNMVKEEFAYRLSKDPVLKDKDVSASVLKLLSKQLDDKMAGANLDHTKLNRDNARKLADALIVGVASTEVTIANHKGGDKAVNGYVAKVHSARGKGLEVIGKLFGAIIECFAERSLQPLKDFYHNVSFAKLNPGVEHSVTDAKGKKHLVNFENALLVAINKDDVAVSKEFKKITKPSIANVKQSDVKVEAVKKGGNAAKVKQESEPAHKPLAGVVKAEVKGTTSIAKVRER